MIKTYFLWLVLVCNFYSAFCAAATTVNIAVIVDLPTPARLNFEASLLDELNIISEGEFQLNIQRLETDLSYTSIQRALERVYSDPGVDMVLVAGIVSGQVAGARKQFPKPTFLPFIIDRELLDLPLQANNSGIKNLNYLTSRTTFSDDIASFHTILPFKKLVLLLDAIFVETLPKLPRLAIDRAKKAGFELTVIPIKPGEAFQLPPGTDAALAGGLLLFSNPEIRQLSERLIAQQIPSYSLSGEQLVELGLLAADKGHVDLKRIARLNALNMQAVMLGQQPQQQPVILSNNSQLVINMATARAINVWPSFDILSHARLLNPQPATDAPAWTLKGVAQEAVQVNLDLLAQSLAIDAGAEDIRLARAQLLPAFSASSTLTRLDQGSPQVQSGISARQTTSGSLVLEQTLWAEPLWANLNIQHHLQNSREAELQAFRLDVVQLATVTFLDILRAQTQLRVQQDNLVLSRQNLDFARNRVKVGTASTAEVYRWESQVANVRQQVLSAEASRLQAVDNLSRILHRPFNEVFKIQDVTLKEPIFALPKDELDGLVKNRQNYFRLTRLLVEEGIKNAPELRVLDELIQAKQRELRSAKRQYYTPTISLQSQLNKTLEEDRLAGAPLDGESDWNVRISASLPLFQGGERRAEVSRATLELKQLKTQRASAVEKREQQILAQLHAISASHGSIDFSRQAATAARKNLELVRDTYSQGIASVIDLLDAQNAALQAEQAAANAVYNFVIDVMNLQRAIAQFDFFLSDKAQQEWADKLRSHLRGP